MSEPIHFHSKDPVYCWLSNFHVCPFTDTYGQEWKSVEHFYQAGKTLDPAHHEAIRQADSPLQAKQLGKKVELRPNWNVAKLARMYAGLQFKFNVHSELTDKLIRTGSRDLIHLTPWGGEGDTFWGIGRHGNGANRLGKMIEAVRTRWIYHTIMTKERHHN